MKTFAVDLGGTRIKLGLIDNGKVIDYSSIDAYSNGTLASRLPEIRSAIDRMLSVHHLVPEDIGGIGFAFPGIVNPKSKKVLSTSKKFTDAVSVDLEDWCITNLGLKMILENDANAAIFGEYRYGCAKGYDNVVLMILGTGVGTAAIMDGKILRGEHFQAGCLGGHFITAVKVRNCSCGGKGCLEANASTWALPEIAQNSEGFSQSGLRHERNLDFQVLENWVRKGDVLAKKLLEEFISQWSAGLVNLVHAYDPELIVLSGGIMKSKELILNLLTENVRNWAWTPWGELGFTVAENPDYSVLLGLHGLLAEQESSK